MPIQILGEIPLPTGRGFQAFRPAELVRAAGARRRGDHFPTPLAGEHGRALLAEMNLVPGAAASRSLERLAAGEAVSVGCGQQPGILGGPYLVLLKAATTVALARRLTKEGVPTVPIFWNAADDSDFEEGARAWSARADLSLEAHELDAGHRSPGRMLGSLPSEPALDLALALTASTSASFSAAHPPDQAGTERAAWVDRLWREAAQKARDLGELLGFFLMQIFREDGLVVVDSRSAALRRAARPVLERYLARWREMGDALEDRARELAALGEGRVLPPSATGWCLFGLEEDRRVRLEEGLREVAAQSRLRQDPPAVSPNVVLRPIVEDYLFPHVARVVGPAEIRYHDEIVPAYDLLGVARPAPLARASLSCLPREAEGLARRAGQGLEALWSDYDGVLREAARGGPGSSAAGALARLRHQWTAGWRELEEAWTDREPSFAERMDRCARVVDFELKKLEEGLSEVGRRALYRESPRLRHLKEYLFPRGRPQERVLSSSSLLLAGGEPTPRLLGAVAERHLDRLLEGKWSHFLVSSHV